MPNPNGPPMAARRRGGITNVKSGHWDRVKKLGASAGGSTSRDLGHGVHGMSHEELSKIGTRGGKVGGPIQGRENARIGWLRHISLLRYEKSHDDCSFCKKFAPPSGLRN